MLTKAFLKSSLAPQNPVCCETLEPRTLLSACVQGTAWTDFDADGVRDAGDGPLKNLVVYSDDNGNGLLDQSTLYATRAMFRMANADGDILDSQTVASPYARIVDLNVKVNAAGMNTQTLTLYLVGPTGQRILLAQDVGANMRGGFRYITFDDQAANPVSFITSAPTGTFRPMGSLAEFNAMDPNGKWSLEVHDSSPDTSATVLYNWTLAFTFGEVSATTAADGSYSLEHLDAGTHVIRQRPGAYWTATFPTDGAYSVTLADGQTATGLDFAAYPAPAQIRGVKWLDSNGNGVRDVDESVLPGWTVYIDTNRNHRFDAGEPSAVTDSTGSYVLDNVPAGQHAIAEVLPPLWQATRTGGLSDRLFALCGDGTIRELSAFDFSVIRAFRPPEAVSGLAIGDGSLFVAAKSGTLWELNPDTGLVINRGGLPGVPSDAQIAYMEGKLYVASASGSSIQVLDATTFAVEATWDMGTSFWGLTAAAQQNMLYAGAAGKIVAIDPATGAIVREMAFDRGTPLGLAWQNGRLIVAETMNVLLRANPESGLIESKTLVAPGGYGVLAMGGDGAADRLVQLAPGQVLAGIDFGGLPMTAAPTAIRLASQSDTGASASDGITRFNNSSPAGALEFNIAGTIPGATVWLYDGANLIGSLVAQSTTATMSTDGMTVLADGTHRFIVRQQAPGEVVSAFAWAGDVTIDTEAPLAPAAPDLQALSDLGRSSTDNLTSDNTPTFDSPQMPYFRVYRDGAAVGSTYSAVTTFTDGPLADGTYSYSLVAIDAAGNESAMGESLSITVDTASPQIVQFAAGSSGTKQSQGLFLTITLSEDVDPSAMAGMLRLQSSSGKGVDLSLAVFSYDALTRTATWDLSGVALTNGGYIARFTTSGVQDLAGNTLNGGAEYVGTFSKIKQSPKGGKTVATAGPMLSAGSLDLLSSVNPLKLKVR